MNLQDLMLKMKAIDEGKDMPVEECGEMPAAIMHAEPQKQQDNVTMNISMNGQGAGGIKDLMDIIRSIEKASSEHDEPLMGEPSEKHSHDEPLMGDEKDFEEAVEDADGETFANSPHGTSGTQVKGIDAVTATGDDMNSKGKANPHYSPGNNTLRQSTTVHEGLVEKLQAHYEEIKTRGLTENTLTDHTGHTLSHILNTHKRDVKDFQDGGDMSESLYDALYDYYFDDMPYGVKKARDGDPYEWISDRLDADLGHGSAEHHPVDAAHAHSQGMER
jgi:hypothetical protein